VSLPNFVLEIPIIYITYYQEYHGSVDILCR